MASSDVVKHGHVLSIVTLSLCLFTTRNIFVRIVLVCNPLVVRSFGNIPQPKRRMLHAAIPACGPGNRLMAVFAQLLEPYFKIN